MLSSNRDKHGNRGPCQWSPAPAVTGWTDAATGASARADRRLLHIEPATEPAAQSNRKAAIGLVTKTSGLPLEMVIAWRNDCSIMPPRISPKIIGALGMSSRRKT